MGQARRRGTFEERRAQAIAKRVAVEQARDAELARMSATVPPVSQSPPTRSRLAAAMLGMAALGRP